MSSGQPVPQKPYPPKPESDTNIMGVLGLILGLFGFFTIIAAPIGLVLSCKGLKHPQNGIAVAGLIVSIISTIWAAVWLGVLILYFGIFALFCGTMCFGISAAGNEAALQNAAETAIAQELEMQSWEVNVRDFSSDPPFSDTRTFTGTAIYTDQEFNEMAIDFAGDAEKVSGTWEINNIQLQGEPYEWTDPYAIDDGEAFDEMTDDSVDNMDGEAKDGETDAASDEAALDTAESDGADGTANDDASSDGDAPSPDDADLPTPLPTPRATPS